MSSQSSGKSSISASPDNLLQIIQARLKESEQNFYQAIEAMPQMVWIARPDGYHEFYNKQWYDFTNTTFEDTKNEGWKQVFHPEDRTHISKIWRHSLKTGEPYQVEYRLRNGKTGEWRWVLARALPLRNTNGKIIRWIGTCTDIDEQKRYSQIMKYLAEVSKILSSSLDYKTTFTNIAKLAVPQIADWVTIQVISEKGIEQLAIAHVDPAKVKWAKELSKKYPVDINASQGVPQVLRSGKSEFYPVISEELIKMGARDKHHLAILRKVGFRSAMVVPIKVEEKTIGAITFVSSESLRHFTENDLTMAEELAFRAGLAIQNATLYKAVQEELKLRKKLETQLIRAKQHLEQRVKDRTKALIDTNAELQRSNRELEDFAYVASHDLQEPLRKIQAFGDLLEEEYSQKLEEGKLYVDRMQHAAVRMRMLIEDLLAFSRVTTKAQEMVEVDLNKIIKETLSDMEVRIKELHAKIEIEKLPVVKADPMQMRQLFQNLISNALKFHKKGVPPHVKIYPMKNLKQRAKHIIYVEDNGIGFDEKYTDRIFTVFQRLHGKDEYEGTGVGLAVVRKIIERHRGIIMAKSRLGQGAKFILTLPMNKIGGDI